MRTVLITGIGGLMPGSIATIIHEHHADYFPFIENIVAENGVDYAFVQPKTEIVEWGQYPLMEVAA
jgi:carbamoyl-phosphate synthase large subunit